MPEGSENVEGSRANASDPPAKVGRGNPQRLSLKEDAGIAPHLVYITLAVGTLLTGVGGFVVMQATKYTVGVHFSALVACCGLGMILAAAGGRAVGTWKSWSVAGAAAAAPLLFVMQWYFQPQANDGQIRGELQGTGRFEQITIWGHDSPFYVRKPNTGQNFQFVALEHQVSRSFYITVTNEDGKTPKSFTIYCLSGNILKKHMGKADPVELAIRAEGAGGSNPSWFVYEGDKKFGKYNDGDCENKDAKSQSVSRNPIAPVESEPWQSRFVGTLIGTAYAQTSYTKPDIKALMTALNSESSDSRVAARVDLSKLMQPSDLKSATDLWDTKISSYRQDLGVISAWNTAIGADRAAAVKIAQAFSPSQITYLAALTGYPDQTMRYGATKLISWFIQATAWPSGVGPERGRMIMNAVLSPLKSSSTAIDLRRDVQFETKSMMLNLLVALDWSDCLALKVDQREVQDTLRSLVQGKMAATNDTRAQDLARNVLGQLSKCPSS